MSSNYSTVDFDCLLLMVLIFAVFSIINLVPLLYRGRTPIDNSLLLQVKVCRLISGPEVLDVEFESTKLDCVTSCQPMIV